MSERTEIEDLAVGDPIVDLNSYGVSERRGLNSEIPNLEWRVVEAAVRYVCGVGYDGSSLQQEADAIQRFASIHIELVASTKALIAARESVENETIA
jgi:hypothetical protein